MAASFPPFGPRTLPDLRTTAGQFTHSTRLSSYVCMHSFTSRECERCGSFQDLALKYAKDLELDEDMVLTALEELQKHSIDRYKAIEHFKETGVATLRITIPTETNELKYVNAGINLDALGCELLDAVASQLEIDVVR